MICYNLFMSSEIIPIHNSNGRNDRFSYAEVLRDGERLFLKTAITPELASSLQRELLWANFVNHVGQTEPEAHVLGPRIIGFDINGGLLMEYIDAPLVAAPSDGKTWKSKIERYSCTLALLDKHASDYRVDWPHDVTTNIENVEDTWRRWFGDNYDRSRDILARAKEIIDRFKDSLTFCVQHGDLTPWQMFERGDDWIIYDGEKAGDHLPRYNDLAYGYGRLFTRLKDPTTAATLLSTFLKDSNVDHTEFFEQFLPVLTFRATGMLADAYSDQAHESYVEEATRLLQLCFEENIENFLPSEAS